MTSRFVLAAALSLAALATTAGPAAADSPLPPLTLHYTGATQIVTVPPGITGVKVDMTGGTGADADTAGHDVSRGGDAAAVSGYATVVPGDRLAVSVAGGGRGAQGGWGYTSGGAGGSSARDIAGGGGGGSSAVVYGGRPLAVAGAGGGAGGGGDKVGWRGGSGASAGTLPRAGESSYLPGAGGGAGSTPAGAGAAGAACGRDAGGGGGGGGAGAPTSGGGGAGGCGGYDELGNSGQGAASYGGGGGGTGASSADGLTDVAVTTAATRGDGSVTLTWYTSLSCHDATQVIDSTTATHDLDVSTLCAGSVPNTAYALDDETDTGHITQLDPHSGRATYTVARNETAVGASAIRVTNAAGVTARYTLTFVIAPRGTFGMTSDGMALDGGNGDLDNPAVAEKRTGAPGQRWALHDNGDGTFALVNAAQGNCLTIVDHAEGVLDGCADEVPEPLRITGGVNAITLTDAISGFPLGFPGIDPGVPLGLDRSGGGPTWTLAGMRA